MTFFLPKPAALMGARAVERGWGVAYTWDETGEGRSVALRAHREDPRVAFFATWERTGETWRFGVAYLWAGVSPWDSLRLGVRELGGVVAASKAP